MLKTLRGWPLLVLALVAVGVPIGWHLRLAAIPVARPEPVHDDMLLPAEVFNDGGPLEAAPRDALLAGETDLYLAGGAAKVIVALPKSGGDARTLAKLEAPVAGMALARGSLWAAAGGEVLRIPLEAGAPAVVATGLRGPGAIAADADAVFVADAEGRDAGGLTTGSRVLRLAAQGKNEPPQVLGESDGAIDALAVDDRSVYWADPLAGTIVSVPKSGGALRTLASERGLPEKLRLYAGTLYWVERRSESVWRMPASGGTPTEYTQDFAGFANLVLDDRGVWWSNEGAVDGAFRVLLASKPGEALAESRNVDGIDALATDGQDLYWDRAGVVERVAK